MENKAKKGKKPSRKEKIAAKKAEAHKVGLTGPVCFMICSFFSFASFLSLARASFFASMTKGSELWSLSLKLKSPLYLLVCRVLILCM